jgi:hypothetical protein
MNARDNTPLRVLIAAHLDAAGECAALAIAKAIGKGDVPSVVVKELNAMRTDGQVECEQRKKEMLYWLAVPLAQIAGGAHEAPAAPASDLPPGVREGTRAAQIYRTLPKFGAAPMTAREIATATGCAKGLIAPVLTAMDKAGQLTRIPAGVEGGGLYGYTRLPPAGGDSEGGETDVKAQSAEIPPQITPQIPPPQHDPDAVAFKKTGEVDVIRTLADARLRELVQAAEILAPCVPGVIDTSDMSLIEIAKAVAWHVADLALRLDQQTDELRNLRALNEKLEHLLQSARNEAEHLRRHARHVGDGTEKVGKYQREIKPGVWIDVYDVLHAWRVTNPAMQHLVKKALQPGERGHKTMAEDLNDIIASANRAAELEQAA